MANITISIDKYERIMFYDNISGRFFLSTIDDLNEAVTKLNESLMEESIIRLKEYPVLTPRFISLNDFYTEIDLPPLPSFGDDHGLFIHHGERLDINYSLRTPISDGSFYLAIDLKIKTV